MNVDMEDEAVALEVTVSELGELLKEYRDLFEAGVEEAVLLKQAVETARQRGIRDLPPELDGVVEKALAGYRRGAGEMAGAVRKWAAHERDVEELVTNVRRLAGVIEKRRTP